MAAVILASRQYPQGGVRVKQANTTYRIPSPLMGEESKVRVKQVQHNLQNPLSLDGRGIKGEGENDA